MKLLIELCEFWRLWRSSDPLGRVFVCRLLSLPRATQAVEWTDDDATVLRDFLAKPTGMKLRELMDRGIAENNGWAVQKSGPHLEHACGFAQGFNGAWRTVESFTQIRAVPDQLTELQGELAASAKLEHLRP